MGGKRAGEPVGAVAEGGGFGFAWRVVRIYSLS